MKKVEGAAETKTSKEVKLKPSSQQQDGLGQYVIGQRTPFTEQEVRQGPTVEPKPSNTGKYTRAP